MPIYLICGSEDPIQTLQPPYQPALLGFHLAADYPSVLGPDLQPPTQSRGYMVLQDNVLPPFEPTPALAHLILDLCTESFDGLVCDFDRPVSPFWEALVGLLDRMAYTRGATLLVPEQYAPHAPHAFVMLAPGMPEEGFAPWLEAAASRYRGRAAMQLLPARLQLCLPSPSGVGLTLRREQLRTLLQERERFVFRDSALLCEYFGFLDEQTLKLVLFDTAQTLQEKLRLAEQAGCVCALGLYQELHDMI